MVPPPSCSSRCHYAEATGCEAGEHLLDLLVVVGRHASVIKRLPRIPKQNQVLVGAEARLGSSAVSAQRISRRPMTLSIFTLSTTDAPRY